MAGRRYPGYDSTWLKDKPKGLSDNEYFYRGASSRWKKGKYRKQAEAKEGKEHRAYRKDNPSVKAGDGPIEGTKEEYVRRNQVADKLAARRKVAHSRKSSLQRKKAAKKRIAVKK